MCEEWVDKRPFFMFVLIGVRVVCVGSTVKIPGNAIRCRRRRRGVYSLHKHSKCTTLAQSTKTAHNRNRIETTKAPRRHSSTFIFRDTIAIYIYTRTLRTMEDDGKIVDTVHCIATGFGGEGAIRLRRSTAVYMN